jgi:hypothetical protein
MTAVRIDGADDYVLQASISDYADEAYTTAKKLVGTGITSPNPKIDKDTETFTGQVRWHQPINPVFNVASLTNSADGDLTEGGSEYVNYIKTVRTVGKKKVNIADIIKQDDGLAKMGRDFAELKAQGQHTSLLSVLKGVAISEALMGAGNASGQNGLGGQTFENDPDSKRHGFYVDLGSTGLVAGASAAIQGAARAESFLNAFGMAFKDYEADFAYLVTSPMLMAGLRSANLIDSVKVTDGMVEFNTIFDGKFRLISSRATTSLSSAEMTRINTGSGVDIVGTKLSFIVLPGAVAMEDLTIPVPVEIERKAGAYKGGGSTEIWHRFGQVMHPAGYDWVGEDEAFPSDADYMATMTGATQAALTATTSGVDGTTGVWVRKASSVLSLGVLPIFHG